MAPSTREFMVNFAVTISMPSWRGWSIAASILKRDDKDPNGVA
jgi:hypothetical protein